MIAARLATMPQGARTDLNITPIGATSNAQAAVLLNVGHGTVDRRARIEARGGFGFDGLRDLPETGRLLAVTLANQDRNIFDALHCVQQARPGIAKIAAVHGATSRLRLAISSATFWRSCLRLATALGSHAVAAMACASAMSSAARRRRSLTAVIWLRLKGIVLPGKIAVADELPHTIARKAADSSAT
jgi:hypothetical protein